jgi:hypothetical protein
MLGIAWYRGENYGRLLDIFEDSDNLPATYEEWFVRAEASRKTLEADGARVICVDIDPDKFSKWCTENGRKPNSRARIEFCNAMAYLISTGGQSSDAIN